MTCTVLLPDPVAPHSLILAMVLSMLTQIDFPQGRLEIFSPLSISELFQDLYITVRCHTPKSKISVWLVALSHLSARGLPSA